MMLSKAVIEIEIDCFLSFAASWTINVDSDQTASVVVAEISALWNFSTAHCIHRIMKVKNDILILHYCNTVLYVYRCCIYVECLTS